MKKLAKKLTSLGLALCLLVSSVPMTAFAAEEQDAFEMEIL